MRNQKNIVCKCWECCITCLECGNQRCRLSFSVLRTQLFGNGFGYMTLFLALSHEQNIRRHETQRSLSFQGKADGVCLDGSNIDCSSANLFGLV